jgi:hypothetical protein
MHFTTILIFFMPAKRGPSLSGYQISTLYDHFMPVKGYERDE